MGERSTACGLPGEPGSRQVLVTHRFLPLSSGEFPGWMLPSVSGHSLLQALPPWSHAHAHCYSWLTPLPSNSEPLSSGMLPGNLFRESFGPCRKASLLGLRTYPCWVSGHPPRRVCAHPDSAFRIPALLSSLCPLIWCLSMLSPALTFHAGFSRLLPAFFSSL